MLTKIEELEIRVGELVKENHELREAGTRLAKENIRKHFLLKQEVEQGMRLYKENVELHKELEKLKKDKEVKIELEHNKWYHTTDFTEEELKELLPIGTTVFVEKEVTYHNIEKEPPTKITAGKVLEITEGIYNDKPFINIGSPFNKEWFKII